MSDRHSARITMLLRVLAGSVILLGLIGTRDVFVRPEARVAGSIFLKSAIFAWGPQAAKSIRFKSRSCLK